MSSIFTGPFEDGYREFPTETGVSSWLILTPILIGIFDIIYCYILHKTSLRLPITNVDISSKQNDLQITTYTKCYNKVYAFLMNSDYSEYYLSEGLDEEELLSHWVDRISTYGSLISGFSQRNSKRLFVYLALRIWSLGCACLFFVLMLVLFFNIAAQLGIAILKYKSYYNLFMLFFMASVDLFFLKRFLHSMYLLFYNITDKYNMWIAPIWRATTLALTIAGAIGINAQQNIQQGIYATDNDFWKWFAVLMIFRAFVWAWIVMTSSIVNAVYMTYKTYMKTIDFSLKLTQIKDKLNKIKAHSKLNVDIDTEQLIGLQKNKSILERGNDEEYQLKLWMLLFNFHPSNGKRVKILKIVYVAVIWCMVLAYTVYLLVIEANEESADATTFAVTESAEYYYIALRAILVIYYFFSIFNRGLYHSLFYLWSGQYHIAFWGILKQYDTDSMRTNAPVIADMNEEIELGNMNTDEQKTEETEETKQNELNEADRSRVIVLGPNEDIIVYPNVVNPLFPIQTKPILFDDFWTSILPNTEDYFHCRSNALIFIRIVLLMLFCVVFMAIIVVFISQQKAPEITNTTLMSLDHSQEILTEYPFCEERWNGYLNMLDMSYLINTAYQVKFGYEEIAMRVEKYFINATENGWSLKYIQQSNPGFYHLRNTKYNFDIIAIRGTQSFDDMLQDADLFVAQYVLQFVSKLVPITSLFPYTFIRSYIYVAGRMTENLFTGPNSGLRFDYPVYNYIRWNLWEYISASESNTSEVEGVPDYTLYIIGHSLGGAIADIVASHLSYEGYTHIKTVTLSSPGLLWASEFFKMDVVSYTTVSYAVLNLNDPICNIDQHIGTQTWIHCDAPQISAYCHKVSPYMSSVINNCGEDFETNINATMLQCIKREIYTQWKTCCFLENWECGGAAPLHNATTNLPIEITANYPRS